MWDDELKADGARTPIGPHSPGPILYMCGSEYVGETTLQHPDTTYRHTLPNRFARCLRHLAHPSHALASPPAACSRGARHRGVGGQVAG
jgi:hypothetical protein